MKTTEKTAATLRSLIRWTTGTLVAIAIPVGACIIFPLLASLPALALTSCLSLFIGLNIALPPLDPENDWVPIQANAEEELTVTGRSKQPVKSRAKPAGQNTTPIPAIDVLPVHYRRSQGAPTGTWNVYHPEVSHCQESHTITLDQRITLGGQRQQTEDTTSRKEA